jgi:hypothetical protein
MPRSETEKRLVVGRKECIPVRHQAVTRDCPHDPRSPQAVSTLPTG